MLLLPFTVAVCRVAGTGSWLPGCPFVRPSSCLGRCPPPLTFLRPASCGTAQGFCMSAFFFLTSAVKFLGSHGGLSLETSSPTAEGWSWQPHPSATTPCNKKGVMGCAAADMSDALSSNVSPTSFVLPRACTYSMLQLSSFYSTSLMFWHQAVGCTPGIVCKTKPCSNSDTPEFNTNDSRTTTVPSQNERPRFFKNQDILAFG